MDFKDSVNLWKKTLSISQQFDILFYRCFPLHSIVIYIYCYKCDWIYKNCPKWHKKWNPIYSPRCMAKGMQYELLEGVSCDSQTAWTFTLAASIVGKEILLHNGPDGSGRPSDSSLALLQDENTYFNNNMAEKSCHVINNTGTWLTKAWNWESWIIPQSLVPSIIYGHTGIVIG